MNDNQQLFNKLSNEISIKRKELPKIKDKLDKTIKRYEKLKEEIISSEVSLKKLKEKKEEQPNKENSKIFYKFYIPMLLLSLIPSALLATLTDKLLFFLFLSKLTPNLYITLGILTRILGIIIPTFTGPLIVRIIYLKKLKKSKEKIVSSPEYQELLKEIKKLESSLDFKKSLQKTEEKNINERKAEYNLVLTEITMKETLLMHLRDESKVSYNNIQNKEEQEEKKVLKRVRKKD